MPSICVNVYEYEIDPDTGKLKKGTGYWVRDIIDEDRVIKQILEFYDIEIVKD